MTDKWVDGQAVPMTPEEQAEYEAYLEKKAASRVIPFQLRVREAYTALTIELQQKYETEIAMAAFHLERGNLEMVAVNILKAEAKIEAGEEAVQAIIDAAKAELGL